MTAVFGSLALMSVIWFLVAGLAICDWLSRRSFKINYIFIRLFLPLYVNQYKTITTAETGKPGPLYYHWIISINCALVLGIAAIVSEFA